MKAGKNKFAYKGNFIFSFYRWIRSFRQRALVSNSSIAYGDMRFFYVKFVVRTQIRRHKNSVTILHFIAYIYIVIKIWGIMYCIYYSLIAYNNAQRTHTSTSALHQTNIRNVKIESVMTVEKLQAPFIRSPLQAVCAPYLLSHTLDMIVFMWKLLQGSLS